MHIHKDLPKDTITSETLLFQAKLVYVGFLFLSFLHKHSISYENIECNVMKHIPLLLEKKKVESKINLMQSPNVELNLVKRYICQIYI